MPKVFIHVGFSKTGTTLLQEGVFRNLSGYSVIGRPFKEKLEKELLDISYSESYEPARKSALEKLKATIVTSTEDVILSNEEFTSFRTKDRGLIADYLKQTATDAEIIFVIREPLSFLKSYYTHQLESEIHKGGFVNFTEWFSLNRKDKRQSPIEEANFYDLINYYISVFGREKVHVLVYEEIKHDLSSYAEKWANILGTEKENLHSLLSSAGKINAGIRNAEVLGFRLSRFLLPGFIRLAVPKPLRKRIQRNLVFGKTYSPTVPKELQSEIRKRYAESNRKLDEEFNLDLKKYGYFLG